MLCVSMDPYTASPRLGTRGGALMIACALLAGALGFAACGSDEESATAGEAAAADASAFPAVDGRTLVGFAKSTGLTQDIVVSPAGQTYEPGRNGFWFGVW